MRKTISLVFLFLFIISVHSALATNGDLLEAIGPIARSMGGVGIAAPQDAISAVFANPAAMCFGPYCPSTQVDFAGTVFLPHPSAKVGAGPPNGPGTGPGQLFSSDADEKVYPIPAIGLSYPLSNAWPYWRFGLAAYGVSGLGVDYRSTILNQPNFFNLGPQGRAPLVAGDYTNLQILKFAPSIAAQPYECLSFGVALHIDYETLDLGQGTSSGFGVGAQIGAIYKLNNNFSLGLSYVTPQNVDNDNVLSAQVTPTSMPTLQTLKLELPQQVGAGLSYQTLDKKLLLETDVKWINWADANGYEDFDWKNQWVVGVGGQYQLTPCLTLRAGYNFGQNPVKEHNGWTGGTPTSFTKVQGFVFPNYYFESFRIVGFPAIVEHHLTFGLGYQVTPRVAVNVGYVHAFKNTIEENGTDLVGNPARLASSLSEDSAEFGLSWRF